MSAGLFQHFVGLPSTAAAAAGNVIGRLAYIQATLIGAANNSGGTATAGTLMAKSNKIINDIATINTNVTNVNKNSTVKVVSASGRMTSNFNTTVGIDIPDLAEIISIMVYSTAISSSANGCVVGYRCDLMQTNSNLTLSSTTKGLFGDSGNTGSIGSIVSPNFAIYNHPQWAKTGYGQRIGVYGTNNVEAQLRVFYR